MGVFPIQIEEHPKGNKCTSLHVLGAAVRWVERPHEVLERVRCRLGAPQQGDVPGGVGEVLPHRVHQAAGVEGREAGVQPRRDRPLGRATATGIWANTMKKRANTGGVKDSVLNKHQVGTERRGSDRARIGLSQG